MNTRQPIQTDNTPRVLSLSFSSSTNRFIAGLSEGIRTFRSDNCFTTYQPESPFDCSVSIAEALDDRYLAYVCSRKNRFGGPTIVVFWDSIRRLEVTRFDFYEPVLGIRLTSTWMAVILEERTILFQYQEIERPALKTVVPTDSSSSDVDEENEKMPFRAPNLTHSLHRTAPNTYALATLSKDLLILPAQSIGQVQLVSLKIDGSSTKRVLRAHNSSIRCLGLSADASVLATASEQGTLIRVYETKSLNQIVEHRRGVDQAIIHSLAFSPGNRWVASTSDKGTLHVFDLRAPDPPKTAPNRERKRTKSQSYGSHRLSGGGLDRDSQSGSSPAPSTAAGTGVGNGHYGSVQEYYGLRPPPTSANPPAREAAVSAIAAFKASSFAPRILKDSRSVASGPFYTGNDPPHWQGGVAHSWTTAPNGQRKRINNPIQPLVSDPSGKPPKGIMAFAPLRQGYTDDDGAIIYVIGGGSDARWEMFEMLPATSEDGVTDGWALINRGFRKYLSRQFGS